ncbi:VOC family protein [Mesobacillus foraminis]|uniref:VOC family protein n=1 Tax=Mesobacillus foraminis TaxID=279826 RepID=UPI001BE5DC1C|nr:VOC family protein [Mesobacillus foraminis]MBT2757467.1 VOC family protein [Mesobacillus foraminis]
MEKNKQDVYLKNFLQVRLVSDFNKSKIYYQTTLGFKVDEWGHAELGNNLGFMLQQADNHEDIRPNAKPGKVQWEGQNIGWDSYFYSNFEGVGQLYKEFKSKGAIFAYELKIETMGNSQWKEFAVKDLDGYVMVFGGGK